MTPTPEEPLVFHCRRCGQDHTQVVRDGKPMTFGGFAFFVCDALSREEWALR